MVLVGGSLAAGAANALNCYIDRDIDQLMRRTSRRPLPTHTVSPRAALVFGLVLAVVSIVLMAAFTNWLATALTAGRDRLLRPRLHAVAQADRPPQNTFWGGVCGAAPVLIGWAAVTGSLAPAGLGCCSRVVFFWQLPHFYALAIKFKDDYARAGIPMLPVVAVAAPGRRWRSVIYTWLTRGRLAGAAGRSGMAPDLRRAGAGRAARCSWSRRTGCTAGSRRGEPVKPMRLFHWSTTYLTIVFVAVAVDALHLTP